VTNIEKYNKINKLKAFVIGSPINHSLSPILHKYWLNHYNIAGSYKAIEIKPVNLPVFFKKLQQGEYRGGNITIPHKTEALKYCDFVSKEAKTIGAVNTLIIRDNKIYGSNTDLIGFCKNLDQQAPNWDKNKGAAIVLGAGGAARAILVALTKRGFSPIHILNRSKENAIKLANELKGEYLAHSLNEFENLAANAAIVINTSSIGMGGTRFDSIDLKKLPKTAIVCDIVYTPLITPLLQDAKDLGLIAVDGLGMLLHQAAPGFEAWFAVKPEVTSKLRSFILKTLEAR